MDRADGGHSSNLAFIPIYSIKYLANIEGPEKRGVNLSLIHRCCNAPVVYSSPDPTMATVPMLQAADEKYFMPTCAKHDRFGSSAPALARGRRPVKV